MVKPFVLTFLSCVFATLSVYARATDVLIRTVDPTIAEMPDSIPVSLPDSILTTQEKDEPVVYETTSETDSIVGSTYNLDEVVVEADKEVRLKNGMAYYPGEEIKKFSYDGINLLSRMIIPTLRVNPFNNTVTSMSGGDVTYFINGMRSTYEEVMAIDPCYINRIDVLQNPTEAKYQGAETVIDYVVTRYLWGGFTKVAAAGGIPSLFANGDIQSGFTYKRMTYNIYLSSSYSKLYDSSESLERFSIDDIPCSIKSEDKLSKGHTTGQKGYVSALYESTNVKFKNTTLVSTKKS